MKRVGDESEDVDQVETEQDRQMARRCPKRSSQQPSPFDRNLIPGKGRFFVDFFDKNDVPGTSGLSVRCRGSALFGGVGGLHPKPGIYDFSGPLCLEIDRSTGRRCVNPFALCVPCFVTSACI